MIENQQKQGKSLWRQKGFYVSAACLLLVLAAIVYFAHLSSVADREEQSAQKEDTSQEETYVYPNTDLTEQSDVDRKNPSSAADTASAGKTAATEKTAPKAQPEVATASASKENAVSEATPFTKSSLTYPAYGTVLNAYSGDTLVKSKTLDEWRYHGGIDIAVKENAQVKVVADGVVEEVYTDPDLGRCVVIDHQNGFKSLYGNLLEKDLVKKGDKVKKEQIIGGVGKTAISEVGEEPHLHFEMWQNDKAVNPSIYLRKTAIEP